MTIINRPGSLFSSRKVNSSFGAASQNIIIPDYNVPLIRQLYVLDTENQSNWVLSNKDTTGQNIIDSPSPLVIKEGLVSGKYYYELSLDSVQKDVPFISHRYYIGVTGKLSRLLETGGNDWFGVYNIDLNIPHITSATYTLFENGDTVGSHSDSGNFNFQQGSVIMFAVDATGKKMWFGHNGVWDGDPVEGTGNAWDLSAGDAGEFDGAYWLFVHPENQTSGNITTLTQPPNFIYQPPNGFG